MKAYEQGNRKIKIKEGIVVKEVSVLFPIEHGGDIIIEAGDKIRIEVLDKIKPIDIVKEIHKIVSNPEFRKEVILEHAVKDLKEKLPHVDEKTIRKIILEELEKED